MHGLHIEEPLVRLLDSRDEEVQLGVTMAINALADHEGTCKALRTRNAAEPLKELIHITKDRDIAKEAKEALSKVAPEMYASLNLKDRSYTDGSYSSTSESGSYSDDDEYVDENDSDGGSVSDSSDTDMSASPRKKGAALKLKQEEAKRLEEQRKVKEAQKKKLEEAEKELVKKEGSAGAISAEKDEKKSGEKPAEEVRSIRVETGEREKEKDEEEEGKPRGSKRKIVVPDGADTIVVNDEEDDVRKLDEAGNEVEEELRLRRKESARREDGEVSDSDAENLAAQSRITIASEPEEPPLSEAEKLALEEKRKEEAEAYKKKMEADTKKKGGRR